MPPADRDETRKRFDEVASSYDTRFVRFIDKYDEMHEVMMALIDRLAAGALRILDLGTGTGELSRMILARITSCHVHGVDFSEKMIEQARSKLAGFENRFTTEIHDLADYTPDPEEPFDLIVSALAIHHLTDADKSALMRRACAALRAGGVFMNGDLVRGETEREQEVLEALHLGTMRSRGMDEEEIQERLARHRRHDIPATLPDQMRWLRNAGCREVWVPWRHLYQAIVVGIR